MSIFPQACRTPDARRWIVRLLLFVFALRALIPVGFMPDLAAARNGNFQVVICTIQGMTTVEVDGNGKIIPEKTGAKAGEHCVFSVLGTLLLPTLDGNVALTGRRIVAAEIPSLAADLPPVRAGPQLGSRGPPKLS